MKRILGWLAFALCLMIGCTTSTVTVVTTVVGVKTNKEGAWQNGNDKSIAKKAESELNTDISPKVPGWMPDPLDGLKLWPEDSFTDDNLDDEYDRGYNRD